MHHCKHNKTTRMKFLVTGTAGFIGMHTVLRLLERGHEVVGLDNLCPGNGPALKRARLAHTGIDAAQALAADSRTAVTGTLEGYRFYHLDLTDGEALEDLFRAERPEIVIQLAAQAGVRYSIENPRAYISANVTGMLNVLECCRHYPVRHLVMASSSSVYGNSRNFPFREDQRTDTPDSLYAATKKSDELMAHTYSKLFGVKTSCVRPFTVYGPWGRPDMAPFLFLTAILENRPIKVFNHGDLLRDFTYVDDVVEGLRLLGEQAEEDVRPYEIYNLGNSHPVRLMDFITTLEGICGREAVKEMLPMQAGDVYGTYADTAKLHLHTGFKAHTSLEEGLRNFYAWYTAYSRKA